MPNHFLSQFVQPGDLVFDIGVRRGQFTDQFLMLGAIVVIVEPMPDYIQFVREKYANTFDVACIECAVTDAVGTAELHYSQGNRCSPSLFPERMEDHYNKQNQFDSVMTVRATTINTLIEFFGVPAFCKIDTEGSEYNILRVLKTQIPALSFEWGGGYVEEAYKCVKALGNKFDYEFNYVTSHHTEWQLPEWARANDFEIIYPLMSEQGKSTWGNVYARAH